MGFIKHLLFWPVTGPNFLAKFALSKVGDTVREELTNDQAVKEDLLSLQMRLELGEIDDDEYVAEEALLMDRLREVRHWKEQFGLGTSGGPVRMAGSGAASAARAEAADLATLPAEDPTAAEDAVATPEPVAGESEGESEGRGGIASSGGASVEVNFDWD